MGSSVVDADRLRSRDLDRLLLPRDDRREDRRDDRRDWGSTLVSSS
jgi:hypothetical protein